LAGNRKRKKEKVPPVIKNDRIQWQAVASMKITLLVS
jgi:hypothetical protein